MADKGCEMLAEIGCEILADTVCEILHTGAEYRITNASQGEET